MVERPSGEEAEMFIQVIQARCGDADRLKKQLDRWEQDVAPGADGWLGSTSGVTDDGTSVAVVRFDSRESADKNSARPEQDAWWRETESCFEGEVSFSDYDDAFTMLDGGSDDAGFVQVMRGRVDDAAGMKSFMQGPMDGLREMRPEIIGGTVAVADDGGFTQTIYFTSEAAAREGEKAEMPAEVQEAMAAGMGEMRDLVFFDLRDPWFSGRS
jgi:hypothetical protein